MKEVFIWPNQRTWSLGEKGGGKRKGATGAEKRPTQPLRDMEMSLIRFNETPIAHLCGKDDTQQERRWGEGRELGFELAAWWKEKQQWEFRAVLLLNTVCLRGQANSPGDRAVCLLITSEQDEPSSAAALRPGMDCGCEWLMRWASKCCNSKNIKEHSLQYI